MSTSISLFGNLKIESTSHGTLKIRKTLRYALLGYLILKKRPVSRESICAIFWPNESLPKAKAKLRNALARIKKDFKEILVTKEDDIFYNVDYAEFVDVYHFFDKVKEQKSGGRFEYIREKADLLDSIISVYKGELLAGFDLLIGVHFESWLRLEREVVNREVVSILVELIELKSLLEDFDQAIIHANKLIELSPFDEKGYQLLMELHRRNGNLKAAQLVYEQFESLYRKEFNEPLKDSELKSMYQEIGRFLAVHPSHHNEEGIKSKLRTDRYQVPIPKSATVGRQNELQLIRQYFALEQKRLVTIKGVGGVGKTHLAKAAANVLDSMFDLGAAFIDLSEIPISESLLDAATTQTFLVSAINRVLKVPLQADKTAEEMLFQFLRQKSLLLVLDNFEHLTTGRQLISKFIEQLPNLRLLVTSRELINIRGEQIIHLGGLGTPESDNPPEIEASAGVTFFLNLVREKGFADRIDSDFIRASSNLVKTVDGLPLALEITSQAIMHYSPEEIQKNLMDVQVANLEGVSTRHLTLENTFDFSWNLLSKGEKELLLGLSIFENQFHRQAAASMPNFAIPTLTAVIQKSMLQSLGGGFYTFHPLLKEFIKTKQVQTWADDHPKWTSIRSRFAAYYLNRLIEHTAEIEGFKPHTIVEELRNEEVDIEKAVKISVETNNLPLLLAACRGLTSFYKVIGAYSKGEWMIEFIIRAIKSAQAPLAQDDLNFNQLNIYLIELLALQRKWDQVLQKLEDKEIDSLEPTIQIQLHTLSCEHTLFGLEQPDNAIQMAEELLNDLEANTNEFLVAGLENLIGLAHTATYRYAEAINWLEKALSKYLDLNLGFEGAKIMGKLASLLHRHGEPDPKILAYFNRAINYAKNLNLINLASFEKYLGKYQLERGGDFLAAFNHLNVAKNIYDRLNEDLESISIRATLGEAALIVGQYEQSLDYFQSVKITDRAYLDKFTLGRDLMDYTHLLTAQYQFEEFDQVQHRIKQLIPLSLWEKYAWSRSKMYLKMGLYGSAPAPLHRTSAAEKDDRWMTKIMILTSFAYYSGRIDDARYFANLFWGEYTQNRRALMADWTNWYNHMEVQMGDLLRHLGEYEKAKTIYHQTLVEVESFAKENHVGIIALKIVGSKAGLADIAFEVGDVDFAVQLANEVYEALQKDEFAYHINLFEPYLIASQIFGSSSPEKTSVLLGNARRLIEQISNHLASADVKHSFLNRSPNVPELRKLIAKQAQ